MSTPAQTSSRTELEPGSFRDPESRVFYAGNDVYRSLSAEGLEDFKAVAATKFWEKFQADGRVVATELVEGTADLPETMVRQSAGVLKHERIPFVSYPYEWPFSMLKDAALLQLDLNPVSYTHLTLPTTPYV